MTDDAARDLYDCNDETQFVARLASYGNAMRRKGMLEAAEAADGLAGAYDELPLESDEIKALACRELAETYRLAAEKLYPLQAEERCNGKEEA